MATFAALLRVYSGNPNHRIVWRQINTRITAGTYPFASTVAAKQVSFAAGDVNSKVVLLDTGGTWTLNADGVHHASAAQQLIGSAEAVAAYAP